MRPHPQENPMTFKVTRQADTGFDGGLRGFFEYRDLGIAEATSGKVRAHVIRAVPGDEQEGSGTHWHELEFQMVYILKGWVVFEYAGEGRFRLEAGDCVHQPPGIRHAEIEHSSDLEMLEITLPADFATQTVA